MTNPPPRVLIADDDRQLVNALRIRLTAAGYDVVTAPDSYQAVALARNAHPDVLLLDVNMPAGDGFSVRDRVVTFESGRGAKAPVIYMTGDARADLPSLARRHGAFAIVHKPFATAELLETIEAALDGGEPEELVQEYVISG